MPGYDRFCRKVDEKLSSENTKHALARYDRALSWVESHPIDVLVPAGIFGAAIGQYSLGESPAGSLVIGTFVYGVLKFSQHLHDLEGKKNPVYKAVKYFENKRGEKKVSEYFNLYDGKFL